VPVRIRPARASFESRASNGVARQDNRLAFVNHALFAGHRAAGQKAVMLCLWVYEHAFDFDALFATVGSEQRRQLLRDMGIEHVYDSRSLEFADLIRRDTVGYGVDIVLKVYQLTADGSLPMSQSTHYPLADAATAIRMMSGGQHTRKRAPFEAFHLPVGELDAVGAVAGVQFGVHSQPSASGGRGDGVDDDLMAPEWAAGPVHRDGREQPVLDLVHLDVAGGRWQTVISRPVSPARWASSGIAAAVNDEIGPSPRRDRAQRVTTRQAPWRSPARRSRAQRVCCRGLY
jgi:hypothetical protein